MDWFEIQIQMEYLLRVRKVHLPNASFLFLFKFFYEEAGSKMLLSGFMKLYMGLVVLVKKMSVLINFLLQNTNLVSVLSKIYLNFAGHV